MDIIELFIDENDQFSGIQAISVVENPAIEEDFIALKNQELKLAEVDAEKKILMGAALIPNKPIYRKNTDKEYYIYFSKKTVKKASELFLMRGNQNKSTLEHELPLQGLSVVESWIVEDEKYDKSRKYDLNAPIGTWMVAVKVNNDEVWNDFVKTGKVKGFSIEGYFADKLERPNEPNKLAIMEEEEAQALLSEIKNVISLEKNCVECDKVQMESFSDYPDAVKNNAKRGIELNKKVNNKCATDVGKIRAQQLAQGKPISVDTIKRMYSYLSRAEAYYKEGDNEACGTISFLLWGGLAGKRWSESKLKQLEELQSIEIDENYMIIDDRLAYSTQDMAEKISKDLGCEGFHVHNVDGKDWYMPCEQHSAGEKELKAPCWPGYEQIGTKIKNGRKVPNCVPIK